MKISIYVMTHKKALLPPNSIYQFIQVGKAIADDLGYIGDDTGDNISDLNPLFGELTGIYWVWKNDFDSDVIGICHYRRFFMNHNHAVLTDEDIKNILNDYEIITSNRPSGQKSTYEAYAEAHNKADYDTLGKVINELYPDYYNSFIWFKSQTSGCFGNLCIMPRKIYANYCDWLFNILLAASNSIDVTGYDLYHRRVYGFLSEILLNIWIHHNNVIAYECPVMFTSEKAETIELKAAISKLVKNKKIDDARSLYYDIIKIRPDVLLPESDITGELHIIEQILYIIAEEERQGINGLYMISDNLSEILEYYIEYSNIYLRTVSGDATTEELELVNKSCLSPIAKSVIARLHK